MSVPTVSFQMQSIDCLVCRRWRSNMGIGDTDKLRLTSDTFSGHRDNSAALLHSPGWDGGKVRDDPQGAVVVGDDHRGVVAVEAGLYEGAADQGDLCLQPPVCPGAPLPRHDVPGLHRRHVGIRVRDLGSRESISRSLDWNHNGWWPRRGYYWDRQPIVSSIKAQCHFPWLSCHAVMIS